MWQQGEAQWMYLAILKGWFSCILELVGAVTGCVLPSRTEGDLRGAVSFCHCWLTRRRCGAEGQTVVTREAYQRGEEAKEEQNQGNLLWERDAFKAGEQSSWRVPAARGRALWRGREMGTKCWQVGGGNEPSARELPGQQGTLTAATGTVRWRSVRADRRIASRRQSWYKQGGFKPRCRSARNTVYDSVRKKKHSHRIRCRTGLRGWVRDRKLSRWGKTERDQFVLPSKTKTERGMWCLSVNTSLQSKY